MAASAQLAAGVQLTWHPKEGVIIRADNIDDTSPGVDYCNISIRHMSHKPLMIPVV